MLLWNMFVILFPRQWVFFRAFRMIITGCTPGKKKEPAMEGEILCSPRRRKDKHHGVEAEATAEVKRFVI